MIISTEMNEEINSTKTVICDCGPDFRKHLPMCFLSICFSGRQARGYMLSIIKVLP